LASRRGLADKRRGQRGRDTSKDGQSENLFCLHCASRDGIIRTLAVVVRDYEHMPHTSTAARFSVAVAFVLVTVDGSALLAQSNAAGRGAVVGTGVFTSFVENMDRSLAFYHDVFDMEVPPIPASGERPYNAPNPRLFAMFQINGAKERHQSARVPGTRLAIEVMEIQNIDHKTINLRIQDPGVATPVFVVRDLDAALVRVKQANLPILTPGGAPVPLGDEERAILIRDLDGRPVEITQRMPAPGGATAATSNILDLGLSITVNDMDRTMHIYRDVLGFTAGHEIQGDKAMRALTGLSKATVRRNHVQATGSPLSIEFVEFKGVERTPLQMRIQDRGAARLQLRAQNIENLVDTVKAAGLPVLSEGAVAVPIPPNFRGALVADPNMFFLTLFEPCDGCASFGAAAKR
jgi:catechol 2,3-dioxygenase-like lactoylglutathione lyase family enzyme